MKNNMKILSMLLVFVMLLTVACSNEPTISNIPDENIDVVVVGGGMGGLSASIEAARLGAKVVLLEKLSFVGGSSAHCEGYLWSSDAKINIETGQGFDVDTMTQYLIDNNPGKVNEDLIKNITHISAEVLDTYMDEGLRMNFDEFTFGAMYKDKVLMALTAPSRGVGMIQDLKKIAEDKGVDIRVSSPVIELLTDDNGAVTGVTVKDEKGTYKILANTVVLATGGFAEDDQLMKEFAPTYAEHRINTGTVGATGDAHKMVLDLGGSMIGKDMVGTYTLNGEASYVIPEGVAAYSCRFVVNKEGSRFSKEFADSPGGVTYFKAVSEQTGAQGYAFFDTKFAQADVLEEAVAKETVKKADTLEALAKIAGIDYAELAKEVEAYNDDYKAGKDDNKWGLPNEQMTPLLEGPFYMMDLQPWSAMGVLAGIKVNNNCQVLGENDQPIPNLYGSGEFILANVTYDRYPTCGTALATGMYGGVIAVRHALDK